MAARSARERYLAPTRAKVDAIKLAAGCADCGYAEHAEALDFDHRPGEEKRFSVSMFAGKPWEVILAEIAKCDVVCANCHRVRTAERRKSCSALV